MKKFLSKIIFDPSADPSRAARTTMADEFRRHVYNNDLDAIRSLLETGVSPKITEDSDHSALLIAADEGHLELCALLIEHGASPNYRNDSGESPLGCAITAGHIGIARLLLEHGANPDGNDLLDTPLSVMAADAPEEMRLLLKEYGCKSK